MGIEAIKGNADDRSERMPAGRAMDATAAVRFGIGGLWRFLSHAETLRVFERACVRAGVPVKYSQGFNPHLKLSLPLPRPVGVASDEELLVLKLFDAEGIPTEDGPDGARQVWQAQTERAFNEVLPGGIVVHSVAVMTSRASFQPESARYIFDFDGAGGREGTELLQEKARQIMARDSLVVERVTPKRRARRVDIRPFIRTLELQETWAVVECRISDAGSVRVDELMALLELKPQDLRGPVRRQGITWKLT